MTAAMKQHDELMFEEFDYEAELDIQIREDAEKHMRCYRYWTGEAAEVNRICNAEIQRIEAYRERELSKIDKRLSWHLGGLVAYLKAQGKKTLKMIHGTIRKTAGRERIEIEDEGAFLQWADLEGVVDRLTTTTVSPSKSEIATYYKKFGAVPTGINIARGEDSYNIQPANQ